MLTGFFEGLILNETDSCKPKKAGARFYRPEAVFSSSSSLATAESITAASSSHLFRMGSTTLSRLGRRPKRDSRTIP